ncbi:hypothetical protein OG379_22155 [Streptomyces sp. NBC_01166]|uniref:hypothetical protein n=1 Tax=Streptomyces sp. NBC_01166 TaxID=2903755 RepID=UPI00386AF644|nr:hypothetical protein OG379_22155 [Streptomyces sp. NBC_01166]
MKITPVRKIGPVSTPVHPDAFRSGKGTRMVDLLTGVVAIAVSGALGVAGERAARRRKRAFWDHYGTYEGFRRQVDEDKVRAVRGARGDVAAIKAVRGDHPLASLVVAKRYVQEL